MTFDWGPDGSKAEDCFFGIVALDQGYSFNFIQVEKKYSMKCQKVNIIVFKYHSGMNCVDIHVKM